MEVDTTTHSFAQPTSTLTSPAAVDTTRVILPADIRRHLASDRHVFETPSSLVGVGGTTHATADALTATAGAAAAAAAAGAAAAAAANLSAPPIDGTSNSSTEPSVAANPAVRDADGRPDPDADVELTAARALPRGAAAALPLELFSIKTFTVVLPHANASHELTLHGDCTIEDLTNIVVRLVHEITGREVPVHLVGLPKGHPQLQLAELKLKAPHRLVAVPITDDTIVHSEDFAASPEEALRQLIEAKVDAEHQYILRDADEDAVNWADDTAFARRVRLRARKYVGYVKLHELNPAKKNLILDIDYTILDTDVFNNTVLTPSHWCRPNLHEFLARVYPFYNIVVWSATGNAHVEHKLAEAGCLTNPNYEIAVLVDYGAMVRISVSKRGMSKSFNTKPLAVLWTMWPTMTPDNCVIVDDHRRSFVMNAENGIHIAGYRSRAKASDREFEDLTNYLLMIRDLPSVRVMHHEYWREVARGFIPMQAAMVRRAGTPSSNDAPGALGIPTDASRGSSVPICTPFSTGSNKTSASVGSVGSGVSVGAHLNAAAGSAHEPSGASRGAPALSSPMGTHVIDLSQPSERAATPASAGVARMPVEAPPVEGEGTITTVGSVRHGRSKAAMIETQDELESGYVSDSALTELSNAEISSLNASSIKRSRSVPRSASARPLSGRALQSMASAGAVHADVVDSVPRAGTFLPDDYVPPTPWRVTGSSAGSVRSSSVRSGSGGSVRGGDASTSMWMRSPTAADYLSTSLPPVPELSPDVPAVGGPMRDGIGGLGRAPGRGAVHAAACAPPSSSLAASLPPIAGLTVNTRATPVPASGVRTDKPAAVSADPAHPPPVANAERALLAASGGDAGGAASILPPLVVNGMKFRPVAAHGAVDALKSWPAVSTQPLQAAGTAAPPGAAAPTKGGAHGEGAGQPARV